MLSNELTCDDDISAVFDVLEPVKKCQGDLGFLLAKEVDFRIAQADLLGHDLDILWGLCSCNIDVGRNL